MPLTPITDGTANTMVVGETLPRLSPQGMREALAGRVMTNPRDRQAVAHILDLLASRRTSEAVVLLPPVPPRRR